MLDYRKELAAIMPSAVVGTVVRTEGTMISVAGFPVPVGAIAEIDRQSGVRIEGEVVAFREGLTLVSPLTSVSGVRHGSRGRFECDPLQRR